MQRLQIVASARALFPKSANAHVQVAMAFRPRDSVTGVPEANGSDGWSPIHQPATAAVLRDLEARGFTHVNLECHGTANSDQDASIASLL